MAKNYYEILGVKSDASKQDIHRAYVGLAKKYHPDINPDSATVFRDINVAYDTLKDPEKRAEYDMSISAKKSYNTNGNQSGTTSGSSRSAKTSGKKRSDNDDYPDNNAPFSEQDYERFWQYQQTHRYDDTPPYCVFNYTSLDTPYWKMRIVDIVNCPNMYNTPQMCRKIWEFPIYNILWNTFTHFLCLVNIVYHKIRNMFFDACPTRVYSFYWPGYIHTHRQRPFFNMLFWVILIGAVGITKIIWRILQGTAILSIWIYKCLRRLTKRLN